MLTQNILKQIKKYGIAITAVVATSSGAIANASEVYKPNILIAQSNQEQAIGGINAGDGDQHCKYWYGSSSRVSVFDPSTSVFVCSKNGHGSTNGGASFGTDMSINGGIAYDEEASEVNVAFDDLCVGKYQYNSYNKVEGVSNIRYDYWAQSCVGTFGDGGWF
jgi:hypothetical protein